MKKLISFALCAVLALALCVPAAAFTDVAPGAWYAAAVEYCRGAGLMDGMSADVFAPNDTVTRAQLVTTLWRLAGRPGTATVTGEELLDGFTDVSAGAWYADAVRWAVAQGVTDGVGGGLFAPDRAVTREMMATFFYRFAGQPKPAGADFADQSAISEWAQAATRWAAGEGLMQGVGGGVFDPKSEASRAALAQLLMNYDQRNAPEELEVDTAALPAGCMPMGAARGRDGAIYVTDGFYKAVWRIDGEGAERIAGAETPADVTGVPVGGFLDDDADKALFASPWAIAPFRDGWAISDPENNVVRVLEPDGTVWTANLDGYDYPTGLAADGRGNLYIANTHAGEVLFVTPEGKATVVASGLDNPMGLCCSGGTLYIAETGARRVVKLSGGKVTPVAGTGEEGSADGKAAAASFVAPMAVAVGADGSVYIADAVAATVRCVRDGVVTTVVAQPDPMSLDPFPRSPVGLLAERDALYVCDRYAGMLVRVASD